MMEPLPDEQAHTDGRSDGRRTAGWFQQAPNRCCVQARLVGKQRLLTHDNGGGKNEPMCILPEKLDRCGLLHPLGRFLVLPVLLGFEFFGQVTLPIAVELGLRTVFAKHAGDVVFVRVVVSNRPPRAERGQQDG